MLPPPQQFDKGVIVESYCRIATHGFRKHMLEPRPAERGHPFTSIISHFDHCFVAMLVKLVPLPRQMWGISTDGLDTPNVVPWFLVGTFLDEHTRAYNSYDGNLVRDHMYTTAVWYVVNSDLEYYFVTANGNMSPCDVNNTPQVSEWRVKTNSTTRLSSIDRLAIEAAINAFMRKEGLIT